MTNITGQDSFIIAEALAIAIEAIDRLPEGRQAESDKDKHDMIRLLEAYHPKAAETLRVERGRRSALGADGLMINREEFEAQPSKAQQGSNDEGSGSIARSLSFSTPASSGADFQVLGLGPLASGFGLSAQPVDATQALNLSAGVSNCKVSRGRSFSSTSHFVQIGLRVHRQVGAAHAVAAGRRNSSGRLPRSSHARTRPN